MSRIKFRLEIWETTVVFQILEMDERFRRKSASPNVCDTGIMKVISDNNPAISDDTIMLRGLHEEFDDNVVIYK